MDMITKVDSNLRKQIRSAYVVIVEVIVLVQSKNYSTLKSVLNKKQP